MSATNKRSFESMGGGNASASSMPVGGTTSDCPLKQARQVEPAVMMDAVAAVNPIVAVAAPGVVLTAKASQRTTHRLRVTLGTSSVFDGTGDLTGVNTGNVTLYDAAVGGNVLALPLNGLLGAALTAGYVVYVECAQASNALDDIGLTLTLNPGSGPVGPPATGTLTCVELTLDVCECRRTAIADPAALGVAQKVNPGRSLHLQRADFLAGRARLVVSQAQPAAYMGNLVLRALDNRVALYAQEVAAAHQVVVNAPVTLANAAIPPAGQVYWVEGATVSGAVRDTGFALELQAVPNQDGDRVAVTVVQLQLDICESRTAPATDPTPLAAAAKLNPGRFVQLANAGHHYGRAKLIVRPPVPAGLPGNLLLRTLDARVRAFAQAHEVPAGAQAAVVTSAAAHQVDIATIPPGGLVLWAEGATASGALRDTGFRLKLEDASDQEVVTNDGDRVAMTVADFTQVQATIHPTPPNTARVGFAAPADHVFTSNHVDPDFAANPPLVLMRNAQPDIELVVTAAPAGLPVRWAAVRNPADHATLGGAANLPTIAPDAGNAYRAVLSANEKGSFRVRAYLDANGNNTYDDGEPSIPLNLVLANATLVADNSAALGGNLFAQGINGYAQVVNGTWPAVAGGWAACIAVGGMARGAGMTMELVADVTGGGANGRLGLDRVFGGLVNMMTVLGISAVYRDPAGPTDYTVRNVCVSNRAQATAMYHAPQEVLFRPTDPAPAEHARPFLDTGRPAAGQGGETAVMGRSGIYDAVADQPVGRRYTLRCIDSPGSSFHRVNPGRPSAYLHEVRYALDFTASFCFWTNVSAVRGATGHAADRVYCVLRQIDWGIAGVWDVDSANPVPVLTNTTPHAVAISASRTIAPIGRAEDHGVEVRGPTPVHNSAWVTT